MNVLGLSYGYHDAAAALVVDGAIVSAAQEERFSRIKHDARLPVRAINSCLHEAGLSITDVDVVAFYEKPYLKFSRSILGHLAAWPFSFRSFMRQLPPWLAERLVLPHVLKTAIAYENPIYYVKHHHSHAASAFYASAFERAALLVSDGVGEWATLSWGVGEGRRLRIEEEQHLPHSIGLVYSAISDYLGFSANGGEGKTMGLADWGEPEYLEDLRAILRPLGDGSLWVDTAFFDFFSGRRMVTRRFLRRFGPPRRPEEPIEARHRNMAASLQAITEEIMLAAVNHVHARTGLDTLCVAGGVFLNCPLNSRILNETPIRQLYIQPAAGDAGGALGAACLASQDFLEEPRRISMPRAALGPAFDDDTIGRYLQSSRIPFERCDPEELLSRVARRLAAGEVVGWFQGRMEFGPRALGQRSILASPAVAGMKDRLNARVKHRESFRPYGVSILRSRVGDWFERGPDDSPFMLHVLPARPRMRQEAPEGLHVDGSSRVQTVEPVDGLYHRLLEVFESQTGLPMLMNTSFNDNTEPIVCTPQDACATVAGTEIDLLVMGNHLVEKTKIRR